MVCTNSFVLKKKMNMLIFLLVIAVTLTYSTEATFNKQCVHQCNHDYVQCSNVCKMSLAERRTCLENCRIALSTCLSGSCQED
ncbi:hypothetical protein EG68_08067 [Paragonimus skrjabini miyazakii]|uniref:Uncharacterized protein n=1 Tax=Paragonimus skrjabini miyazakii TaxID=59628 RepID=A0A8S9YJ53_9TREM|nr:hypothetical protein EG68_08067 [Paragonimus skrjabini miyazakii]